MESKAIMDLAHQHIMPTYGRFPIALVRGEGARVWDADGREYLDFFGGIAVNVLGQCHPKVVAAIKEQAGQLLHVSNFFYTLPGAELARLLTGAGIGERVFFCNSGAEANEGAIKLARKFHYRRGDAERFKIIAAHHSFHGRTLATLTASGKPEIWEGFGPLPAGFVHVPLNDIAALEQAVDDKTAAVLLEPIQGEGGIYVATREYLEAARRITRQRGALLIMDEIQSGMGRTGRFFAYQALAGDLQPDVVTLAKGLGGGLPIGAFGARGEAGTEGLKPGDHGSTFGANPVACAAAVATVRAILEDGLLPQVERLGNALFDRLAGLKEKHGQWVSDVRGKGLMAAVELTFPGGPVVDALREQGILINVTAGNVLRFLPPYVISTADIERVVAALDAAIPEAGAAARAAEQGA